VIRSASIWALVVPIILSNITVPLIGAVDTAVMGHMETAAYLGAVAIGGLIFDYIYWGFGFLRLSTTGLVAQALGREDGNEARAVFGRAVLVAIGGTVFLWSTQHYIFLFAAQMIESSAEVEALAEVYFDIRIWSAPAALTNYILIGWMLANKDTKGVLIQQVIINIVNAVVSIWLVMGLEYGVEGVAAASVIAQYTGLGVGLILMKRELSHIKGDWQFDLILVKDKIKAMIAMNTDIFIRTVCLLSVFAWFTAQGAKMGDVILAANAILLQFLMFLSYALDGFAHAVEVLSGHGAGKKDRADFRHAVKETSKFAFLSSVLFSAVYFIFGGQIIGLFSNLQEVLETAETYMIWVAVLPVIAVWGYQLDGVFLGLTQTRVLRNMMLISVAIFIPLSLIFMEFWGNHGLWASFTIFMGLRAITVAMNFSKVEKKVFA